MSHQVPWNKIILEELIRLAILSKDEEAADAARESIPDNGLKVDAPVLGRMTFHRVDVDTLVRMIMEG